MNLKLAVVFCYLVALTSAISLNGYCAIDQDSFMPMIYADGWVTLSTDDIDRKMNEPIIDPNAQKPFNFKTVDKNDKETGCINTSAEYYICRRKGDYLYVPSNADIIDYGNFEIVAMPLIFLSKAKPSRHSYVRDVTFDKGDPLSILPVNFINWAGSDQEEAIDKASAGKKSWREVAPSARILTATRSELSIYDTFAEDFYSTPENERYHGDEASNAISLSVLGDLNGDGYEDIVLHSAHYYVGGSGRSYYFVVLTRRSQDGVLEDITDEVYRILFNI